MRLGFRLIRGWRRAWGVIPSTLSDRSAWRFSASRTLRGGPRPVLRRSAQALKPRAELREEPRLLVGVELVKIPLARYPAGKSFEELRLDARAGVGVANALALRELQPELWVPPLFLTPRQRSPACNRAGKGQRLRQLPVSETPGGSDYTITPKLSGCTPTPLSADQVTDFQRADESRGGNFDGTQGSREAVIASVRRTRRSLLPFEMAAKPR
jgi:hypothetical protein